MSNVLPVENVWDYPRPPIIEPVHARLRIIYKDLSLADTTNALRILETGHPPTYYIPEVDVKKEYLKRNAKTTHCQWKGLASYFDFQSPNEELIVSSRIWSYENPTGTDGKYVSIKGHFSFFVGPWDCYVNDEKAQSQPGDFYGGWMTQNIRGKVNSGTGGWSI